MRIILGSMVCLFFAVTLQSSTTQTNFDGPAELPRAYVKSFLADTPAPGRVLKAGKESEFQTALEQAACGDVIELEAGAVFRGQFKLPLKNCDDAHWIVIRTSVPNHDLPAEGKRIEPCYAGTESLPGRPPFHCASVRNVLPKLVYTGTSGSGPIAIAEGANHYRLVGLEITREAPGAMISNLVSLESEVHHIVFDRLWIHGTTQDETTRGIFLGGSSNVTIVDSYFSDFHCTAVTGACVDSQAIAGGLGDAPMGPYKIVNNFLEAAGENILFGGGAATATPVDIEIRQNYFFKPTRWRAGEQQFIGAANGRPFVVKNLFELKNAQRVLFEGNVLENSWGGFSQSGFAILLTPKNQGHNGCPSCQVTDVTIRDCKISHVGGGLQIANSPSDSGSVAEAGERYSIHDVVIEDIGAPATNGFGILAQISSEGPTLRDVSLRNITAFPTKSMMMIGAPPGQKIERFNFTSNLVTVGEQPISTTGGGPAKTCSAAPQGRSTVDIFNACFSTYSFTDNVLIGGGGGWPRGNISTKLKSVGFVNYKGGNGGDYRSRPESVLQRQTKEKRFGADIDAVERAALAAR